MSEPLHGSFEGALGQVQGWEWHSMISNHASCEAQVSSLDRFIVDVW